MSKEKRKIQSNRETLDLKEFMLLDAKKQFSEINSILERLYEDTLEITKNHVEKVLDLCFEEKDKEIYLPYNLRVSKDGNKVIFEFVKRKFLLLFLLFLAGFLLSSIASTYMGVNYLRVKNLNIDLNGDGIPDINIDLNKDGFCDINCDKDGDQKPDTNIDFIGNKKAIFNIVQEDKSIFNATNQDTNDDGKCDLNCDIDGDGHPDINIDFDGDGKADLNIDLDGDEICDLSCDTNDDGICDVNCDINGDGKCDLNCDTNNDGICDLNCDTNGDRICDINCDTSNNGIPDKNIDYKGNRRPTFNKPNNPINQDKNRDGKCDINCDIDKDGHPDINIDLDGDGKPDVDIDINNDGVPDINLDSNGDGVCDLNCDDDNDNKCDRNCVEIGVITNGGSIVKGDDSVGIDTASIIVVFESDSSIISSNIYPDDQPEDVNKTVPDIVFSVENTTDYLLSYNLSWVIAENTFTSNNMWYKVSSTNGGYNQDWQTLPKKDSLIKGYITLEPHSKQVYTISMTLHGIGAVQNYDQGRKISGSIKIESAY